ncbi:Enoyl-CoA hydratase domain-containing protein 3, mitochondrial [Nucella lapillus]
MAVLGGRRLQSILGQMFCLHGSPGVLCENARRYSAGPATEEPLLTTTQDQGIRTICLNDPKRRNALSLKMLDQLHSALSSESKDLRVIVLTHTGPVFSAGHDLKELTDKTGREYHEQVFNTCTSVMNLIQDLPVPVVAQVNGLATAAGCQLVATCDIAVVSEQSRFATPGVHVGLFCTTPGVAVGRAVPRKVALEMLFTGQPISAQDALLHGLVSKVVPENTLQEETDKVAGKIREFSKEVTALGKAAFYSQMSLEKRAAYRFAGKVMADNLELGDSQEGIGAFFEKRKPQWKS